MIRTLCHTALTAAVMLALSACHDVRPTPSATAPTAATVSPALATVPAVDDAEAARLAEQVREATRHAWQGYMQHAAGHDELKPLSGQPHDWYASSLQMSPVDALDTLLLLGLEPEAKQAQQLIVSQLSFDQNLDVQVFEITIRLLGGLLSGYQMTHDPRLLALADDLGNRLLPAFNTPSGLPYTHVNLRTGKVHGKISNPAETGTLLLEFGTLAKLTGKNVYYDKAKRALVATFEHRSKIGLVGQNINIETGQWVNPDASIAGGIDSYYEYLLKCWKLFGDADCKAMWDASIGPVNQYLAEEVRGELWYGHVNMHTGQRTSSTYGSLDAFMPGLLALGGDLDRARRLQESGLKMWRLHQLEPEALDYRAMKVTSPGYALRPEIIESAYYLHHYTGETRYRGMGKEFFTDFQRHTRTPYGYAEVADVRTMEKKDSMPSFLFAETFKYYYLLFAPKSALDFDQVVFNTEAHPLRRTW